MVKINRLLEENLELEDYEAEFGRLPDELRKAMGADSAASNEDRVVDTIDSESSVSSSSSDGDDRADDSLEDHQKVGAAQQRSLQNAEAPAMDLEALLSGGGK